MQLIYLYNLKWHIEIAALSNFRFCPSNFSTVHTPYSTKVSSLSSQRKSVEQIGIRDYRSAWAAAFLPANSGYPFGSSTLAAQDTITSRKSKKLPWATALSRVNAERKISPVRNKLYVSSTLTTRTTLPTLGGSARTLSPPSLGKQPRRETIPRTALEITRRHRQIAPPRGDVESIAVTSWRPRKRRDNHE